MKTKQRKIVDRRTGEIIAREFSNFENLFYLGEDESANQFAIELERENNRGWTFCNYSLCSSRLELFYSRGEYELK